MSTMQEIEKLEQQIQLALQTRHKAEGAVEEIMRKLKEQFDVNSLEEAQALLATLKEKVATLSKQMDDLVTEAKSKVGAWVV